MNKKDKEEIQKILADTLNKDVVPVIEKIDKKTEEMAEDIRELQTGQDRIERKLDAQQDRLDRHDKRIQVLESASL